MTDLPDIAFIGRAGSGKSTAAQYLFNRHEYATLSFASRLKTVASQIWGDDPGREKLQRLGVAVREIDRDAWVHPITSIINGREPGAPPAVIDDCRFPNEYEALKGLGFVFVRITAAQSTRVDRLKANGKWENEEQLEHISETALDGYEVDHTINNGSGTEPVELGAAIRGVLHREAKRL